MVPADLNWSEHCSGAVDAAIRFFVLLKRSFNFLSKEAALKVCS
jgi:hypothetical protein